MNFYSLKRRYNSCVFHKTLLVMKLIMILLTTTILQVSASSYAQRITLNETNSSLVKVIDKIRQQSGYDFVYNDFDLAGALNVTLHISNVDLAKVFNYVLPARIWNMRSKKGRSSSGKKKRAFLAQYLQLFCLPDQSKVPLLIPMV